MVSCGAGIVVDMAVLDTVITAVLFIALIPAVLRSLVVGRFMWMLMDGAHGKLGWYGVVIAARVAPITTVLIYFGSMITAILIDGPTWYVPVIALVLGSITFFGLSGLGAWIVKHT